MTSNAQQKSWLSQWKPMIWLKNLYHWVMGWAEHRYGPYALSFVATIEAIFFPIPVDPLLIAMGASKPKKALWYALWTTIFSVSGGLIGYSIGFLSWDATQAFFFQYVFHPDKFDFVMRKFQENAFLTIFVSAFTPLPFKVFTLAAGVAHLNIVSFVVGALLGRGMRFFLVGSLLYKFGPQIRDWLEKYFEKITIAVGALILVGIIIYQFV